MLSKKTIENIAKLFRVKEEDLQSSIQSEKETDLELPELTAFTEAELKTRESNLQKKHYDDGVLAGRETLIKDLKKEHSVEVEGKDPAKFIEGFKVKILKEAGVEPDKVRKELESVISKQKQTIEESLAAQKKLNEQLSSIERTSKVLDSVSKEYKLGKKDLLTLMQGSGYSFEEEDSMLIVKKGGAVLRDEKTQGALSIESVFDSFASEKGLIPEDEQTKVGRGGSSTKTLAAGTPRNFTEFQKQWEEQGKSTNGEEFMAKAAEYAKDNPDFMKQ